jgi:hypothetical protein
MPLVVDVGDQVAVGVRAVAVHGLVEADAGQEAFWRWRVPRRSSGGTSRPLSLCWRRHSHFMARHS